MYTYMKFYCLDMVRRFRSEEEGLALTEYLILLGLLTAAVVAAVLLFGQNLGSQWSNWSTWLEDLPEPAPIT